MITDFPENRMVFTKIGTGQSRIGSPLPPSQLNTLVIPLLPALNSHLLSLPTFSTTPTAPSLLRNLVGSELLVLPFLSLWAHPSEAHSNLNIYACSIRQPPPLSPLPEGHSVSLVEFPKLSPSDLEGIANLVIGFLLGHPRSKALTLEEAKENVRRQSLIGMWIYRGRTPSSPANAPIIPLGLVNLGRPTPRTVAIRGVFVAPEARGQGIAQRMVGSVVRTYLVDAKPDEFDSTFRLPLPRADPTTIYGRKEELCLFVKVDGDVARKLYKRIGFEESEDVWGDFDLRDVESGGW